MGVENGERIEFLKSDPQPYAYQHMSAAAS